MPLGRRRRGALAALLLAVAACGGDGAPTEETRASSTPSSSAPATDPGADPTAPTTAPVTVADDQAEATSTSTTSAAPTTTSGNPATTTTTRQPPRTTAPPATTGTTRATTTTTAAPRTTTTPPPTTTTTAPPPPPPTTTTTTTAPPPSGPANGTRTTSCETFMFNEINKARANAGVGAVTFDTKIQYIAVDWSDHLAGTQKLAHNPNYGAQIARERNYSIAGENVGRAPSASSMFSAFMNSPGHRRNIERPEFTHVTVGCITDAGGQLWATQNFWG